ncbi:stage V sporulation protein E [Effusibacillus lacus]|uniref:Stage V sporulation protein E n=1 Tax=Effusibacillus lacus TaxID=1348429 RepID=A0A292YIU1_9BACL|nr:stage V sporulation protein E [Effusibacillus lacus]TCS75686.1 spore cortex peptidoglycan biosynthesis regulator SpoVE [Effusibacillus lacus]GAX91007.1 stage V sporulation protein E [Effusibacillus lacus]
MQAYDRKNPDLIIIVTVLLLLGLGVVIVYSASAIKAEGTYGDSFYFAKRQLLWAIAGLGMMFFMMNFHYTRLKKCAKTIMLVCFLLLILVLTPLGVERNGSQAWLGIGSFGIQPSEAAKLGLIVFFAWYLERHQNQIHHFRKGLLPPLSILVLALGLIMLEPDLGQSTVIAGTTIILIFAAGARVSHLLGLASLAIPAFAALVMVAPYRLKRIFAFLDPWKYELGEGYQIIQSLYALGPGGLMGLGLGRSRQKFLYLPEPQTDFIFCILAEELGFIGGATVIMLFLLLLWRGVRVAITARDPFGSLLAIGITAMIAVQVIINIGVVTGSMPVTGITLPFISYGGSSLLLMLTGVGILLNISRHSR